MDEAVMDPKPEARHVATRSEWAAIAVTKHGPCRACGSLNIELHHLVSRGQRGSDVASNIIPLCSECHRSYTDRDNYWDWVAPTIRRSLQPDEIAYALAVKSRWWLDRMYPL